MLLADLVKGRRKFEDDSQKITNQTDAHSYLEAFKARQASALGTYTAGRVAIEASQMDIGRKAMGGLGAVQGTIGQGIVETPGAIKSLSETILQLLEGMAKFSVPQDGQAPYYYMFPGSLPAGRGQLPNKTPLEFQEAAFRPLRDQSTSAPSAPVKTELTIHLTGLQPGMSATVMSDSEKFMTKVYSGYSIYNL